MENIKLDKFYIIIKSLEHGRNVQNFLFKLGYVWVDAVGGGNGLKFLGEGCVIISGFNPNSITYIRSIKNMFEGYTLTYSELFLEVKIEYEYKIVKPKKVVTIGENMYFEDDIKEAIKLLKPIYDKS